jgi:hypothetical protein
MLTFSVTIICFKIKNPPPVELCWQKKEIPRISLNPTSRQNLTFGLSQIQVSQNCRTNYLLPYRGCLNVHEKNVSDKKNQLFLLLLLTVIQCK